MSTDDDVAVRVRRELERLLEVLDRVGAHGWASPSLCAGWSVRDLVVHLLMPYELSAPRFGVLMLRNGFRFDRLADRWARHDRRPPAQLRAALATIGDRPFGVPGAPAEAPLSHLVIHAQDAYRPLGVPSPTDPDDARVVLEQLTTPAGRRAVSPDLVGGLSFAATDSAWHCGEGPQVSGAGPALLSTLMGRTAALDQLTGAGVPELRRRLLPAADVQARGG